MKRLFQQFSTFALVLAFAAAALAQSPHKTALGFTPWPVDFNRAGLERTYRFINKHSNLIAHHFDGGIPWDEALNGTQLPMHLRNDWAYRRANTPQPFKVFVAITPLNFGRDGLALAWTSKGDNKKLNRFWRKKNLNDPQVKTAYLNYARQVIAHFQPDYLAIGIEANLIISNNPGVWNDYLDLHAHVYRALKREHPSLQIFSTIQYEHLRGIEDDAKPNLKFQRPAVAALMRHSDLLALSTYRYGQVHPNPMTKSYFNEAKSFGKRIAIAESGALSKGVKIYGVKLPASEAEQKAFVSGLLQHATNNRFAFVVNWVAVDFDPGLKRLPRAVREIAKAWVYTGLQSSDGKDKPALAVWDAYLARSRP